MITYIRGPAGSGKTRYIRERLKPGDLVIDRDAICEALSGLPNHQRPAELFPYTESAFRSALRTVGRRGHTRNVWIATCAASLSERQSILDELGNQQVTCIVLATSPQKCLRNIQNDPERVTDWRLWQPYVEKWWRNYKAAEGETVIRD